MADRAYIYDPAENYLHPIVKKDLRKIAAVQPDFKHAPLHLIYVADYSLNNEVSADKKERFMQFSHAHAGFIGQNVYLYCASAGLSTCFVASIDQPGLSKALGLAEDQYPLYTQIVGYPAK
jgi:nitroreductase